LTALSVDIITNFPTLYSVPSLPAAFGSFNICGIACADFPPSMDVLICRCVKHPTWGQIKDLFNAFISDIRDWLGTLRFFETTILASKK
jgi:hypothetical protein